MNLVALRIDAEKGEGPELRDRYQIPGYPTVVFINSDGTEVDRIVGYRAADVYLSEMERIKRREGTIEYLSHELESFPENDSLIIRIAEKYEDRQDLDAALPYWRRLLALPHADKDRARFKVATTHASVAEHPAPLLEYIEKYSDGPYTSDAYRSLHRFYRSMGDTASEVKSYQAFLVFLDEKDILTPGDLNGYAWRMTQLESNLDDALLKIRKAVRLSVNDTPDARAGIMDTEAEVLWKMNKIDDAVAVIDKCIELQPDDKYFKDQKAKFLKK